jgi:hypothetical protein
MPFTPAANSALLALDERTIAKALTEHCGRNLGLRSSGRVTGNLESAGLNRHVVGDASALQERK